MVTHSKFFHYFPIPSFLRMSAAGLSIDDSCIRFVEIIDVDGGVAVSKYGMVELPPQAIIEGEIKNTSAVKDSLATIRSKYDVHFARVALPDDKVYIFKQRLPWIPEKEIKSALEFKIEENVPLAASEAIFDYTVIRSEESESIEVVVSVAARNTSLNYNEVLKTGGIQALHLGLESQSVADAIVPQQEKGTIIVVNFFSHKTTISIVENNVVQFNLTMRNEEASYSAAMPEGKIAQTEKSLGTIALPPDNLRLIKQELERVLNYWQDKNAMPAQNRVYKIILSGAQALDSEFVEHFSSLIGAPVLVANPWCNVYPDETHVSPISKEESFKYAAAIGLAIGYRKTIRHHV